MHSLALIPPVVLAVGLLASYGSVPDPMPIHWGADGTPDSWVGRSLPLLTLSFTGLAGPWSWAGGGLVAIGGLGALATLIALMLVTGRASRDIDVRYPSPSGRRNRWLVFVDAPGGGIIAQNNRGKYTLNMATTTGRVLTVVVAAVAVVVVVERVTGALAAAV